MSRPMVSPPQRPRSGWRIATPASTRRRKGAAVEWASPQATRTDDLARQALVAEQVVGLEGLFEPEEPERLGARAELARAGQGVGHAAVDHQLARRAQDVARGRRQLDVAPDVATQRPPAQLEGGEALGDDARGELDDVLGGLGHDLAGVDLDRGRDLAAQEPRHRQARHLAQDVPQRHVDRAHRVQPRAVAAVVVRAAEHRVPQRADPPGVLAEQQLAQASRDGVGRGHRDDLARDVGRRVTLADAGDALVGVHAHDERVLGPVGSGRVDVAGAQHQRLDLGDLHAMTSPRCSRIMSRARSMDASRRASGNLWATAVMLIAPSGTVVEVRKSGMARQLMPSSCSSRSSA